MALGKTTTVSVGSGADVAILATVQGAEILVREDPSVAGWPTTDFTVKKPLASSTAIRQPAGSTYTFKKSNGLFYQVSEVAGYLRTVAGTTTFQKDELGV